MEPYSVLEFVEEEGVAAFWPSYRDRQLEGGPLPIQAGPNMRAGFCLLQVCVAACNESYMLYA